jgi:ATPase subunit of ABC transporter with duplicated ATPase domains
MIAERDGNGKSELSKALAKKAKFEKQAAKQKVRVQELLLEQEVQNNPRIGQLQQQDKDIRKVLHRLRLAMGRKQYSIDCQRKKLADTEAAFDEQQQQERDLAQQLVTIGSELDGIKSRLVVDLRQSARP